VGVRLSWKVRGKIRREVHLSDRLL
jgi:hypothetical protein